MFSIRSKIVALVLFACKVSAAVQAQDSGPLLDLLVQKGIINDQEAEDLRAELVRDFAANTSAGKLNMSSSQVEFKLSGDLRLRHQEETQAPETASGSNTVSNERRRERFRFRLNGDVQLQKGWATGFALETSQSSDSGNQTFQQANSDYDIYLSRAYVSWRPNLQWFFASGKQKNPFHTTDLIWDSDINPQGLHEAHTMTIGDRDTLEFRAMQIIMDDRNESVFGPDGTDAWLFAQQAVYTKAFDNELLKSVVLAPGFMDYNDSAFSSSSPPVNETPFAGSTRGLSLATFAGEVNFANIRGAGTALSFYWDSAYNFEAEHRVHRVYGLDPSVDKDALAWLVGVGYSYGSGRTQGDYSIRLDYRHVGLGSVDVNLNDSDWAFGRLNQKGWKFTSSYNLADFASVALSYFYTEDIQDGLTYVLANLDHTNLLQLDLIVKF